MCGCETVVRDERTSNGGDSQFSGVPRGARAVGGFKTRGCTSARVEIYPHTGLRCSLCRSSSAELISRGYLDNTLLLLLLLLLCICYMTEYPLPSSGCQLNLRYQRRAHAGDEGGGRGGYYGGFCWGDQCVK